MDREQASSGGFGFFVMLCILFIALKLMNQIDWSWWWVMAPIWGPFAVVIAWLPVAYVMHRVSKWRDEGWWRR